MHIYSGSLVRFFTNDWENEIQRYARESGIQYTAQYPDGEPKWPTREAAAEHLTWMKETLSSGANVASGEIDWDDQTAAYHTIKLHDEAREAIMIVAAHLQRPELPLPRQMPSNADDDVAYAEAGPRGYLVSAMAPFEASLIVPGSHTRVSFIEDPLGVKRLTCSTDNLRRVLDDVKRGFWRGQVDPKGWRDRGLVFARNSSASRNVDGEWREEKDVEPNDSLKGNAEFAYAAFTSILEFSDRNRTAIATTW